MSVKRSARDFAELRARVRTIILEHGVALAARVNPNPEIDDAIYKLAERISPTIRRTSDKLQARIADQGLRIEIDDHQGAIMATYGDAGYNVGLAVGLELADQVRGGRSKARR
jgi:hypothetical protein